MKIKLKEEKFGNYQFCKQEDLIDLWVSVHYGSKVVVVLPQSFKAFDSIPMLNILKRDKFATYMEGIQAELAFVEFDTPEKACDFVYSFDYKHEVRWIIYNCGKIHTKSK